MKTFSSQAKPDTFFLRHIGISQSFSQVKSRQVTKSSDKISTKSFFSMYLLWCICNAYWHCILFSWLVVGTWTTGHGHDTINKGKCLFLLLRYSSLLLLLKKLKGYHAAFTVRFHFFLGKVYLKYLHFYQDRQWRKFVCGYKGVVFMFFCLWKLESWGKLCVIYIMSIMMRKHYVIHIMCTLNSIKSWAFCH